MDGLDLDLYEPLSYGDDEGEEAGSVKLNEASGRKRLTSGSVDIEGATRSTKRQRVEESEKSKDGPSQPASPRPMVSAWDSDDSDGDLVIDFDEDEIIAPAAAAASSPSKPKDATSTSKSNSDNLDANRTAAGQANGHVSSAAETTVTATPSLASRYSKVDTDIELNNPRFRRVLKRMPQDIPYLPVTCEDGSRLYLRLKEKPLEKDDDETPSTLACGLPKMGLVEHWEAVKTNARAIKDRFHTALAKAVNDEIIEVSGSPKKENAVAESLWVEKYKPRSFLDLLSMEAVNRGLLHWLKLWDKSVFGKDYLAKVKANREKYAKLEAVEKEKDEMFHRKTFMPEDEEYDERGKPKIKIALLAGDPGLGKTTCAHVIARHAGYRIKEINASDDRSTEVFRKALDDTEERTDVLITDGRPKCLVIDEIDGSPAASVKVLVDYALGNISEKGKKKKKCLRRPIICICNDLFAPSLKELRKHAFVIQFPQIPVPRLAERLHEVSRYEHLYIDNNTLQALCQRSDCDIRSCLSTLQFLKKGLCTAKQALDRIGVKDKAKGIYSVWQDIFTLPPEKRYQDAHPDPSKPDKRFFNTLQSVQNHGEYDKLFSGVFENYLRIKYRDIYLQSVIDGLEWAVWFESIQDFTLRSQNYSMYGFLPLYFIVAHFLFARKDPIKLEFPTNDIGYRIPRIQSTIKSQINESQPSVARFLDPYMLITDIYPAILGIIQPCNIRPVPSQIWTQRERDTLKNVVEVMLTYNLTYVQTKNPETGTYSFLLEPDLEDMVRFKGDDGSSTTGRKPFPYAIKQLVAREIETEKMRRNDTMPEIVRKDTFKKPQTPTASTSTTAMTTPKTKAPEVLKKKSPSIIGRDFFGRPILPSEETSPEAQSKKKNAVAIYFRFKEGYSNAVRRYVKMKDL